MTFTAYSPDSVDMPPQLQGLLETVPQGYAGSYYGGMGSVGLGAAPYLIAGGAAVGATIAGWLGTEEWGVDQYAHWMRTMDATIKEWDKLGWETGCWQKNPAMLRQFKAYWARFSKHYGKGLPWLYVDDDEEAAARALMKELRTWGAKLNKQCKMDTGVSIPGEPDDPKPPGSPYADMVKWGAIGIGALVLLNVVTGVRGAFGR